MTNTTALDVLLIQKDDTWDQCNWIVPLSKSLEGLTAEQSSLDSTFRGIKHLAVG
ncbi:hypothetical protein MHI01_01215 [Paenibacillus sp. FSL M7-0656]|uniref:hypothetical protein n=1 Tax=Paenibacillus sp. FSL M7-0656 TaxID=2921534 RepID=UPI0030F918C9